MVQDESLALLAKALSGQEDLLAGLHSLLADSRAAKGGERSDRANSATLYKLAEYILQLRSTANGQHPEPHQPGSKKRKLGGDDKAALPEVGGAVLFTGPDTSFSIPVRKKLRLEGLNDGLRGVDPAGNAEMSIGWDTIEHVFCLPVPEKAKPQHNFVVIPKQNYSAAEPIVWTAQEVNPKNPDAGIIGSSDMAELINKQLAKYGSKVLWPDENEFVSQATKGPVKTFGVRAHRGSKEGYLFFLSPGILFAFKKPLLFLAFADINSISYTSVLQRTFNINIAAQEPGSTEETQIEFAMVDQVDFAGIDVYLKSHGLNDTSLAAEKRAKKYNVNAPKVAATAGATNDVEADQNGNEDDDDDETELQKAERMLQDEEDELEEDYVDEEDDDGSSGGEDYESGNEEARESFDDEQEYDEEGMSMTGR